MVSAEKGMRGVLSLAIFANSHSAFGFFMKFTMNSKSCQLPSHFYISCMQTSGVGGVYSDFVKSKKKGRWRCNGHVKVKNIDRKHYWPDCALYRSFATL